MQRELKIGERYFLLSSQDDAEFISLIAENGLIEIVSKISDNFYSVRFVNSKSNHINKNYITHISSIYISD